MCYVRLYALSLTIKSSSGTYRPHALEHEIRRMHHIHRVVEVEVRDARVPPHKEPNC